jgi:hypothetical protein
MSVELVENNTRIRVTYLDKRVVFIKPVAWNKLDDISLYLKELLSEFFNCSGFASKLLSKESKALAIINQVIDLLPIVGDIKLDLEQVEDIEDIIKIFFVGKYKLNSKENTIDLTDIDEKGNEYYPPSYLSTINSIHFFSMLQQAYQDK